MSSITEQFSAATKSQLEAQFNIFSTFASTAVESAEKVIALNISTTKASVEKSSTAAKKLLEAKDPKEFFSLSTAEPASFDSLLAYGRQLYAIATDVQSELIQTAQSTIKQVTELTTAPVTAAAKTTPPALAAAVSAAVAPLATVAKPPVVAATAAAPANEAVAVPAAPKTPAKVAKPKPAAAPVPEASDVIDVKVAAKPSFPAAAPKPVAAEGKPALKSVEAPKAKQAAKPAGKQLDMLSGAKAKK
jgi:phasin family protein